MPLASLKEEDVEVQGDRTHPESNRTEAVPVASAGYLLQSPRSAGSSLRAVCPALTPLSGVTLDESLHFSFPISQVGFILDPSHRIVLRK